jgi:RNA polymerase sigma factor (TIGR02999 family)
MEEITILLQQIGNGDGRGMRQLAPLVYDELRRLATAYMSRERLDHTLQPTALVHEAFLRLAGGQRMTFENRAHFMSVAAEAMRLILLDHARSRNAQKRGGGRDRIDLDKVEVTFDAKDGPDMEALDEALAALKTEDERRYQVVMLRYFGGMAEKEIAEMLKLSIKTVQRDWGTAKLFLLSRMQNMRKMAGRSRM